MVCSVWLRPSKFPPKIDSSGPGGGQFDHGAHRLFCNSSDRRGARWDFIWRRAPAGDDPVITRYQEEDQSIWVLALGTELLASARPAVELGIFRNSYREPRDLEAVTLFDLFLALRVGF